MKRKIRITAALAAALAMALSVSALAATGSFVDVEDTHWGFAAIEQAFSDGVVNGTSFNEKTGERTFEPAKTVTVAEFAAVMTRSFYKEALEAAKAESGQGEPWYAVNLRAALASRLFEGLESAAAEPTREMTRVEMAVMLQNIILDMGKEPPAEPSEENPSAPPEGAQPENPEEPATQPAQAGEDKASENASSQPAQTGETKSPEAPSAEAPKAGGEADAQARAVATTVSLGLLKGVDGEGTFAGEKSLTRAEMAMVYSRLVKFLQGVPLEGDPLQPGEPQPTDPTDPIPVPDPIEPPTVDM